MKSEGGFTLIEIMVVLVIIGALVAVVSVKVIDRLGEAEVKTTRIQISQLETAVKQFRLDNGFYPETQHTLQALVSPPNTGRQIRRYPEGGYLEGGRVPQDAWGNDFIYIGPDQTQNGSYEIISPGPDAVYPSDDDISNLSME